MFASMYIYAAIITRPYYSVCPLPTLTKKDGSVGRLFYELLYYALFLVKGIGYNFVKATHNTITIAFCFVVLEHKNKISNW